MTEDEIIGQESSILSMPDDALTGSPEDLQAYLNSLNDLTVIEASRFKKRIITERDQMVKLQELAKSVNSKNEEDTSEVDAKLNETYESYIKALDATEAKLDEIIAKYQPQAKSVRFLTEQMIATLEHQLENPKDQKAKKDTETLLEAFKTRLNTPQAIAEINAPYFRNYVYGHRRELKAVLKQSRPYFYIDHKPPVVQRLCNVFGETAVYCAAMATFKAMARECGTWCYPQAYDLTIAFLAYIDYEMKIKKLKHTVYAKILLLDLAAIYTSTYDLPMEPALVDQDWKSPIFSIIYRLGLRISQMLEDICKLGVEVSRGFRYADKFLAERDITFGFGKIFTPTLAEGEFPYRSLYERNGKDPDESDEN